MLFAFFSFKLYHSVFCSFLPIDNVESFANIFRIFLDKKKWIAKGHVFNDSKLDFRAYHKTTNKKTSN